jgi:hypothetical protein
MKCMGGVSPRPTFRTQLDGLPLHAFLCSMHFAWRKGAHARVSAWHLLAQRMRVLVPSNPIHSTAASLPLPCPAGIGDVRPDVRSSPAPFLPRAGSAAEPPDGGGEGGGSGMQFQPGTGGGGGQAYMTRRSSSGLSSASSTRSCHSSAGEHGPNLFLSRGASAAAEAAAAVAALLPPNVDQLSPFQQAESALG